MLDLIIIFIILVFGAIGYCRGIVKTIVTLGSSIVALILSFFVYPVMNSFLKWTPLYSYINKWMESRISQIDFGAGIQTQGQVITENITWIPRFMSEQIVRNNNSEIYKLLEVSTIVEYISTSLTRIVIGMIAILVTWVSIKILLSVLISSLDAVAKHVPVLSTLNKMGGFGVGVLKGLLGIWVVCLLVPILITHPVFAEIDQTIQASYLARWLYENNMILQAFHVLDIA